MNKNVDLPAPTAWPMVLALSVTLLFAGLVTSAVISIAGGILLLCSAVGWWRQVLPTEKHEHAPISQVAPEPIASRAASVSRLSAGRRAITLPESRPWSAAVKGAAVGGFAMAAVALLFGLISQGSIWYPINLLSAAALPDMATASVEQLRQFSAVGLVLALIVHALTSFLVGMLYAVMLPMFPRGAFAWAGLSAPILWSGLISTTLEIINPALNQRIDWRWFIASQLAFGLTGGYVIARSQKIETMEDLPLAVRLGIDAPGVPSHDNPDVPK